MDVIVSVEWLQHNGNHKDLIVLDASLPKPSSARTADKADKAIPNARVFDLKNCFCDQSSEFPNTVPSPEQFEKECQKLGISNSSKIVVYDSRGIYSSPRAWWLFKVMGHTDVYVLDGGLPEWISQGHDVTKITTENYPVGDFTATRADQQIITYHDVVANVNSNTFHIVDARSKGRFQGIEKEPREGIKSGHIQGSSCLPYTEVLDGHKMKSGIELAEIFAAEKLNEKELVFSCGSGLTACILILAYAVAGGKSNRLFDGSWTEWAIREQLFEKESE